MTVKGRILLANDCITVRRVVRISLVEGDYELVTVDAAEEVPSRAREFGPDLILARAALKGRDGRTVAEAVKEDPALSRIPVLLLVSHGEGWDNVKARRLGAVGCINQPFASIDLIAWLNQAVRMSRTPAAMGSRPCDSSKER